MNKLFIVRLQPNPQKMRSAKENIQAHKSDHHAYVEELVTERRILFGGPIIDKPGGMLIVQALNKEEVEQIFSKDPMIGNEFLYININEWQISHGTLPLPEMVKLS